MLLATVPDLVLWRADRCHLCEETAEMVEALLAERAAAGRPVPALVVRRIADDPAIHRALFDIVPVLEVGDRRLTLAVRHGAIRAFVEEVYG